MPRFTIPRVAHCNGGELPPVDWIGAFLIGVVTLPYQWWLMIRQRWQDRHDSSGKQEGDISEP